MLPGPMKASPLVSPATIDDAEVIGGIHVRAWQAAYRGHVPDEYLDSLDPVTRRRRWKDMIAGGSLDRPSQNLIRNGLQPLHLREAAQH
jgi:hypothetical protein